MGRAKALDRPRSWVIAEAIRTYRGAAPNPAAIPAGAAEVDAARRAHRLAEFRLTPEERLRRAASLLRLAPAPGTRRRPQIVAFESYDEFAAWKKARGLEDRFRS